MAPRPVQAVRPEVVAQRKRRIRPRVPSPEIEARGIHHAPAIDCGYRVGCLVEAEGRCIPMGEMRFQEPPLRQIRTTAVRKIGLAALHGLRIGKDVRLVGTLVHRRASKLGEPDGLSLRRPGGGRIAFHARDPVEMRVRPPGRDVLVAIDPGLAVGSVADGVAVARDTRSVVRIVPVEAFSTGNAGPQAVRIIGSGKTVRVAARIVGVAPV